MRTTALITFCYRISVLPVLFFFFSFTGDTSLLRQNQQAKISPSVEALRNRINPQLPEGGVTINNTQKKFTVMNGCSIWVLVSGSS